ncbi:hypothetical protein J1N35_002871 [Gossypium stocksii]|uniref:Peroxisomal membrane protein 11B n=1 Tax=Gossypium stocksii TaxID=47602 RepID=A0A9D4AP44_9ROSI|nr:hypothetical protein J1N35_002871 [Gossypium stocksii]
MAPQIAVDIIRQKKTSKSLAVSVRSLKPQSKSLVVLSPHQKIPVALTLLKHVKKSNKVFTRFIIINNTQKSFTLTTTSTMNDTVDKLVIFLAKRDGIDKLVKTFQYVSKLVNWQVEATHPDVANRFKQWEVSSGLSRKAFRTGRFLTGFNGLRRNPGATPTFKFLAVLANAGEMVYFFFDHFLWLSRIGTLDAKLAKRMSFISAFGESFGYIFFIVSDLIIMRQGVAAERKLIALKEEEEDAKEKIRKIRGDRVMRLMAVAANVADLIIAAAEIEPNPFCNHPLSLGISGLVSAWAGWYRNWPS